MGDTRDYDYYSEDSAADDKVKNSEYHTDINDKIIKSKLNGYKVGLEHKCQRQSPNLSKASSISSLAPSTSSITVHEVRDLSDDYQKMLEKATQEIRKLTSQKRKLEKDQDELLTVNIELATEAKRLVREVKNGQEEKKGLLAANEEFVEEVRRMYREEEKWENEITKLKEENKKLSDCYVDEVQSIQDDFGEEEKLYKQKQESLLNSIRDLTLDNERLIQEKEGAKIIDSQSSQELEELYEANRIRLETTIDCLKSERETELIIKEEVEKQMEDLLEELEKIEEEINDAKDKHGKATKQVQLKYSKVLEELFMKSEKLAAENFEYAVDNVSICLENI